ncbi:hypothetical protein CBM2626_A220047 [Cupriavidus taiwanensis]|nr:hypothetical protein CBM2626_A220047 [Cupriavidus taiwanensis]
MRDSACLNAPSISFLGCWARTIDFSKARGVANGCQVTTVGYTPSAMQLENCPDMRGSWR